MSATPAPSLIEVTLDEIEDILAQAARRPLEEDEREKIRALAVSYLTVLTEIENKKATLQTLRELLFGAKTETKENVALATAQAQQGTETEEKSKNQPPPKPEPKPKPKGHGRIPARDYTGAQRVKVPHESLRPGDPCPCGCGGTVYGQKVPKSLVRIRASAPFSATIYEKEWLRCGLCNAVFVAKSPPGMGEEKYDASVGAMLAVLRYASGLPMNRIAGLQEAVGVPLPVATQWEILWVSAKLLGPVHLELVYVAAQGELVINDDTPMKILSHLADLKKRRALGEKLGRTATQTSGIVCELPDGNRVVLYYTGLLDAGENLAVVLSQRAIDLGPPLQMCDALERNLPEPLGTIWGNCLVHARRGFIRVNESFPDEVRHVVEELALVYKHEAHTKAQGMSAQERLRFHQEHSGPVMARLKTWMDEQITQKKTEPNSGLGKATQYCRKRWDRLTLFLRHAGAPLDSNLVERMLKRAILHRKNSLFYKTPNGAAAGDLFMSLIATAKLAKVDPFDYLTELLRHPEEIAADPSQWLPWNYRAALGHAPPSS